MQFEKTVGIPLLHKVILWSLITVFLWKERRNIGSHKRAFFRIQTGKIEEFKLETQHLHH